jgi:hypothetical protein
MLKKVKDRLSSTRHTLADMARETFIDYRKLNGWANGYWTLTEEDQNKVDAAFSKWEKRCP